MAGELPDLPQYMSGRDPEVERQLGRDVPIRQSTYAVRAEQPSHPSPPEADPLRHRG
jgi:hypothetical protein